MTVVGLLGGLGVIAWGLLDGQTLNSFLNLHGLLIVFGGTFFAVMINSSPAEFRDALKAGFLLLKPHALPPPEKSVGVLVRLAQKARRDGALSLKDEPTALGDGFLARAVQVSLASPDQKTAYDILSKEVNMIQARHREVGNLYRTMGLLAPMFGLLGTLIGIVSVLKNMSDPGSVGPAMSLALSTAFFGILFANLVCVPVAGKLRARSLAEAQAKELVIEGVLAIVFSSEMPLFIQTRLQAFVRDRLELAAPQK
jgi:chemotaxis protein MotA